MFFRRLALSLMCLVCFAASAYQSPPAAYPLDSTIGSADHIFVGSISSAKATGGSIAYEVSVKSRIWGRQGKTCISSKLPYEIGGEYLFFVENGEGSCMGGGRVLRRALPVKTFGSKRYVVFQDEKYLYPDFKDSVLRVDSIPFGATKPIVLWSGVPIELFEAHVRSVKAKH